MASENFFKIPEGGIDWSCDLYGKILEPAPFKPEESPMKMGAHVKNVTAKCRYSPIFRKIKEDLEKKRQRAEEARKKDHVCTKCSYGSNLSNEFRQRGWIRHAMKHTPVDQFHCHLCDHRCRWEEHIRQHLRNVHEYCDARLPLPVTNFDYTEEEMAIIESKARECFPDVALIAGPVTNLDFLKRKAAGPSKAGKSETCLECEEEIVGNHRTMYENKENHIAAVHTKDLFWKCVKCLKFSSHLLSDVTEHIKMEHNIESPRLHGDYKRIATHKQRKNMSEFLLKCFPGTRIPGIIANSKFAD